MKADIEYIIQETVDGKIRTLKNVSPGSGPVVLGRSDTADIPFAGRDRTVSREQFRLTWEKGRAVLENLGKASVKLEGITAPFPAGKKIHIRDGVTVCFEQTTLNILRKRRYTQCRLTFRYGSEIKKNKLSTNVSYSIGRAAENDIQLPAASVSARHCTAFPSADGQLGLTDLNSRNGIKIQDGDTARPLPIGHALGQGDSFILGDVFVSVDFSESMTRRKKQLLAGAGLLALILCAVIMLPGGSKSGSRPSKKEGIAKIVAVLSEDLPCPSKAGRLSSLSDALTGSDKNLSDYCRKCSELYLSLGKLEQRMTSEQESANLAGKNISANPWSPDSFQYSFDARNIQEAAGYCASLYQEIEMLSEPLRIPLDSTHPSLSDLVESAAGRTKALVSFRDNCSRLGDLVQSAHKDMFSFVEKHVAEATVLYSRICPEDRRFKEDLEAISKLCSAWQTEKKRLQAGIEEWALCYGRGESLPLTIKNSPGGASADQRPPLCFPQAPLPVSDMKAAHEILTLLSTCRTDMEVLSACERSVYKNKTVALIQTHATDRISFVLDNLAQQADSVLATSDGSESRAIEILRGMKGLGWKHEKLKERRDHLVSAMYDKCVDLYNKADCARVEEKQAMVSNLKDLSGQMLEILSPDDREMCRKFEKLKRAAERM